MDHQRALNRLRTPEFLAIALDYALFDRTDGDHFFDPFEIEYAAENKDEMITDIIGELEHPGEFRPRVATAFFPPKDELCDRRMVYIPIKDLTIRYAIVLLFAEEIEHEMHDQCFSYRRPTGLVDRGRFTEDFASGGWSRFCDWQKQQCAVRGVLLRTDIAAFYDSISHDYLIDAICRHAGLPKDCPLMRLFKSVLKTPVIYYSPESRIIEGPDIIHQGLPIGDGVEGYLANIFLKDVDDAMTEADAAYGRYVDDIRLFGSTREEVLAKLRVLQERLFRKGLNLNTAKTEIAEDETALRSLVSRLYALAGYSDPEESRAGLSLSGKIDRPFSEFDRVFVESTALKSLGDAKDFCKFLSAHEDDGTPLVALNERRPWHVDRLCEAIRKWRGAGKHAVWLLVQTAVYSHVQEAAQDEARGAVRDMLKDSGVSAYARYRILHHLVKLRQRQDGGSFRFIDSLGEDERDGIRDLMPSYVSADAFELNLIGLYTLRALGEDAQGLRDAVTKHANRGCEPLRQVLRVLPKVPELSREQAIVEREPDEVPAPY